MLVHPSGITIGLDEETHIYSDSEGNSDYVSSTVLVHKFFPEFEEEKIAGFVAKKRGCYIQDVLDEWAENRDESCRFGTLIHRYAECRLMDIPVDVKIESEKEVLYCKYIDDFIPQLQERYSLIGCEEKIFSPDLKISGTIDLLMKDEKNNKICIFDWKTSKEIKEYGYRGETGLDFFDDVPHCNFYHYAIQLSIYKNILLREKYYENVDFILGLFWINETGVKLFNLPNMDKYVNYIFKNLPVEKKIEIPSLF